MWRKYTLIACLIYLTSTLAQAAISDSLYRLLPQDIRPQHQAKPSPTEVRQILVAAIYHRLSLPDALNPELDRLALTLDTSSKSLSPKDEIANNYAVGGYFTYYRDPEQLENKFIPYFQHVLKSAVKYGLYDHQYYDAVTAFGFRLVVDTRYEPAASLYNKGLNIALTEKDSVQIRNMYYNLVSLYEGVTMYPEAMEYLDVAAHFNSSADLQKDTSNNIKFQLDAHKAWIYLDWYVVSPETRLLDSARTYTLRLPTSGPGSAVWAQEYYLYSGEYHYYKGDYPRAMAYLDSSLAIQNQYSATINFRKIFKAFCLLKMNRTAEAMAILKDRAIYERNIFFADHVYSALAEVSEKNQDYGEALRYMRLQKKTSDSISSVRKIASAFEINQRYNVTRKQAEIYELAANNATQKKVRAYLISGSSLGFLILLGIILTLHTRRKISDLKMKEAIAAEKKKLSEFLAAQDEKIAQKAAEAILVQKKKISRDLHDGLTGSLTALKYVVTDKMIHSPAGPQQEVLKDIEHIVAAIYDNTRQYMHTLYNGENANDIQLAEFLESLGIQFSGEMGLGIAVDIDGEGIDANLNRNQQSQLYYIIKECINNTLRHAEAVTKVSIVLDFHDRLCTVTIADNGQAIDKKVVDASGMGLASINARVKEMEGTVHYDVAVDGFKTTINIPLEEVPVKTSVAG